MKEWKQQLKKLHAEWHKTWKSVVAEYYRWKCSKCGDSLCLNGLIHHPGIQCYPKTVEEVLDRCREGALVWLCKRCHSKIYFEEKEKAKLNRECRETLGDEARRKGDAAWAEDMISGDGSYISRSGQGCLGQKTKLR